MQSPRKLLESGAFKVLGMAIFNINTILFYFKFFLSNNYANLTLNLRSEFLPPLNAGKKWLRKPLGLVLFEIFIQVSYYALADFAQCNCVLHIVFVVTTVEF